MKREPVRISDHAILRYLERAMEFNIEAVRQHITGICDGPAAIGAVCVRAEGLRFQIVNNAVTTVGPDDSHAHTVNRTTRERNQRIIQRKKPADEARN